MKQIGFVPSVNGFGHTRRLLSLALVLHKSGHNCYFFLPCRLPSNSKIPNLIEEHKFKISIICTSKFNDGPYSNLRNYCICTKDKNKSELENIDLIIADSVFWASDLHSNSFLLSQFVWQKDLDSSVSGEKRIRQLLKFNKIFGFKYFTHSQIRTLKNYTEIPLLDYWNLRSYSQKDSHEYFGLATSGAQEIREFLPLSLRSESLQTISGLEKFLSVNPKPIAIFCRPGLGAILECLSANIVPVLLDFNDSELDFNKNIAVSNGWAVSFTEFESIPLQEKFKFLHTFIANRKLPEMISPKDLAGLILQAVL